MKRCFKLTLITLTLTLAFSACMKGKNEFTPESFRSTVSFSVANYQYKGEFVFEKEGESTLTITEPKEIAGTVIKENSGKAQICSDGIQAEILNASALDLFFSFMHDYSKKIHTIKNSGIENIEGEFEGVKYTVEIDCEEKRIKQITFGAEEYIFLP